MAHLCVWAIFIPSIALNCLVLTLVFLSSAVCRATPAQRLLLASLFSLHLLTGLCGAGMALIEQLESSLDLPGPEASCRVRMAAQHRGAMGELAILLSSQACVVVLMTAVVWEHRSLRGSRALSTGSGSSGAQRRPVAAASSVVVAVVLCCSTALVLTASIRVVRDESGLEGSACTGGMRCEPNAPRVALNCGGYLLLTAIHVFFCPRHLVTTHARGVTCVLLANALSSVAEALLWLIAGSSVMCPSSPVPQPAGGAPFLLLVALPAMLDPLLYMVLHLHQGGRSVGRLGDRKH